MTILRAKYSTARRRDRAGRFQSASKLAAYSRLHQSAERTYDGPNGIRRSAAAYDITRSGTAFRSPAGGLVSEAEALRLRCRFLNHRNGAAVSCRVSE